MTREHDRTLIARWLLRLLLTREPPPAGELDWALVTNVARTNVVLLRTVGTLRRLGFRPPEVMAAAAQHERARAEHVLSIVRDITRTCEALGVDALFPKALLHYPDLGDDLDLLVTDRSPRVDALVLLGIGAERRATSIANALDGSRSYLVDGSDLVVDVHHGRLGLIGEHTTLVDLLMRGRRRVVRGDLTLFAPATEDQLVLQGLKVYGRRRLRLADVVQTVRAIREESLDWDRVVASARRCGIHDGVSCYLDYVDDVHRTVFQRDLLPIEVRHSIPRRTRGRISFQGGELRLPGAGVAATLYAREALALARTHSWSAAARAGLAPALGLVLRASTIFRRLGGGSRWRHAAQAS